MASGMLAVVGLTVGFGAPVAAAGMELVAARPLQAASRVRMIRKRAVFVRTKFLQRRMQVFYLILKVQSVFRAL
jgi:F0F1-type ATP synthase membrane subunit c/vacuolar-type H+-ATPase subunit K